MRIGQLLREPLVHFLLLGAGLFVVYGLTAPTDDSDRLIEVSESDIQLLSDRYTKQLGAAPSEDELQHLVKNHIRNEILYLEARRMQLDEKDTIVKRRLVQKLEFLIQDMIVPENPTDETLQAYFDKHIEDYRVPAVASLTQMYFSPDKRPQPQQDASSVLKKILGGEQGYEQAREESDRSPVGSVLMQQDMSRLNRQLGTRFVDQLQALDTDSRDWQGPIESGYGIHLVQINEWQASRLPDFEDVKNAVARDWLRQAREEANESYYKTLKDQYTIQVFDGTAAEVNAGEAS
jgi:parvulin-like peptidyl-prolyl cis-trans isomerase-like protein